MYLDVEFTDGTVTHIPVSASHTVRVISPDDHVQDAFSFGGVKSVTLNPDGAPAATDPNPQPVAGAAEGATATVEVTETTDAPPADAAPAAAPVVDAAPAVDAPAPAPVEAVTPDPQQAAPDAASSDASNVTSAEPQTSSPTPTTDDQAAHDQAATAAADAVVAAAATPADDRAAIVAKAQADIEEALAQWPDSQPLLDAKADLEQLAAGQ